MPSPGRRPSVRGRPLEQLSTTIISTGSPRNCATLKGRLEVARGGRGERLRPGEWQEHDMQSGKYGKYVIMQPKLVTDLAH